jgi:hypothetical protein
MLARLSIFSEGIKDNSYQNVTFLKLKSVYQPNKITNSTNYEVELLYGEVGKAELSLMN